MELKVQTRSAAVDPQETDVENDQTTTQPQAGLLDEADCDDLPSAEVLQSLRELGVC